jgi:hypothetical protein
MVGVFRHIMILAGTSRLKQNNNKNFQMRKMNLPVQWMVAQKELTRIAPAQLVQISRREDYLNSLLSV